MTTNEVCRIVEEILNLGSGQLAGVENLKEIGWDSLAVVQFVSEIDERLGHAPSIEALAECKTVSDLTQTLTFSEG